MNNIIPCSHCGDDFVYNTNQDPREGTLCHDCKKKIAAKLAGKSGKVS